MDTANNENKEGQKVNLGLLKSNKKINIAVKAAVLIIVAAGIALTIFFITTINTASLVLSDTEVTAETLSKTNFNANDMVYFSVKFNPEEMKSKQVSVEIMMNKDGGINHHKSISYEVDQNYTDLSASIPRKYFSLSGKYVINIIIDGKTVITQDIEVK